MKFAYICGSTFDANSTSVTTYKNQFQFIRVLIHVPKISATENGTQVDATMYSVVMFPGWKGISQTTTDAGNKKIIQMLHQMLRLF